MANKTKKTVRTVEAKAAAAPEWPYGTKNYAIFAAALLVIIVGFIFLGQGSITLAPLLLVIGYCVLLPIALIVKCKPERTEPAVPEQTE
ncbi:MAG TPA: hypothetical protein VJ983_08440 [candidate division Zixibacteria bacterium]|nr:hypothetical protein [candidate division Zixibacteria bacterium]